MKIYLKGMRTMTKLEILDRVQDMLNQACNGIQDITGDLDLLRHDLELEIIKESNEGN